MYDAKSNHIYRSRVDLLATVTAESNAIGTLGTVANWLLVLDWNLEDRTAQVQYPSRRAAWRSFKEFDFRIKCDAAETLSSAQLFGYQRQPVTLSDDTFTASGATLTATSHAFNTGDGPVRLTTSDTLPAGLATGTDYWIEKLDANTFSLSLTLEGALDSSGAITTTDGGTGTHTLVDVQSSANADDDTQRLHAFLYGDVNAGAAITVGALQGYLERIQHSPHTVAYELVATGAGAETLVISALPLQEVIE